ncbi:MAG: hypothetical protein KKA61_00225, partial [Nanoarchaeota archaeon]|nr:hypothetical protein [Nanoarchaeota archaeon]
MEICTECGKKEVFLDGLCKKCYLNKNPLLISFKPVKILVCFFCRKYFSKGKWTRFRKLEDVIKDIVQKRLVFNDDARINSFKIRPVIPKYREGPNVKVNIETEITVFGTYPGKKRPVKEEYALSVKVIFILCPRCSRHKSGYFEGILQLRDVDDEVIDYAVDEARKQNQRGIFITKKLKVRNGFDIYLTKRGYIHELARELLNKFGGEIKASKKLFSRDKLRSRDIYRINVLFRQSKFRKGDILNIDGELFKVKNIDKNITIINIKTGKKTSIMPKHLKIRAAEEVKETIVSLVFPHVEILHPETFQSVKPENIKNRKF